MDSLPKLVIFDCDGVLVDSEVIAIGVLAECLNEAGVMVNVEQTMAYGVGRGAAAVAAAIKKDFGIMLPANFFADRIIAAYAGRLRPMDGILELLAALKLRRRVASNSPIERVRQALTTTGLMPHLEPQLYSAAMVARGKPAPDLFPHAAQQQGVRPQRCLVIEDS
jgi:beta-phosphoglucomutase-like phosphatase (HAD superfamily)